MLPDMLPDMLALLMIDLHTLSYRPQYNQSAAAPSQNLSKPPPTKNYSGILFSRSRKIWVRLRSPNEGN
jgi:hypothetical protein